MADPIQLPQDGYAAIPGGMFQEGPQKGKKVAPFEMKKTPVTNAEWGALAKSLGQDRFILLRHDWKTGESKLVKKGKSVEEVVGGPALSTNFREGHAMVFGASVLVNMMDNPSKHVDVRDKLGRVFSGAKQPVVGVSYFHAKAWCLLKTLNSRGKFKYDLPSDLQYEYVASDRGTKKYGTENGTLFKGNKKLAHIDEYKNRKGPTVVVDDQRYVQKLPFGVQSTGNVWRLTKFNFKFKVKFKDPLEHNPLENPWVGSLFGLRAGSWHSDEDDGRAAVRIGRDPTLPGIDIGFSPVRRQELP